MGRDRLGHGLAYAGVRQDKVVIPVRPGALLSEAVLPLAQRGDATPNRRHGLAQAEGEALHDGGVDLPAVDREHLLDCTEGTEDDAVLHVDQAPAPYGLHSLRIVQRGQRRPARRGRRALGLTAGRLRPRPLVGQQGRQILPKPISEQQRGTVGGQDLRDMVDHARRHREGAIPAIDRQQQLRHGVAGRPHPVWRA